MKDALGNELSRGDVIMYPGRAGSSVWMRLAVVLEVRENTLSVAVVQTAYHSDSRYKYRGTKKTVVQFVNRTIKVHPSLWNDHARQAREDNGFSRWALNPLSVVPWELNEGVLIRGAAIGEPNRAGEEINVVELVRERASQDFDPKIPVAEGQPVRIVDQLLRDPIYRRSCPAARAMLEDEAQMQHTVLDAPTD